MHFSVMYRLR